MNGSLQCATTCLSCGGKYTMRFIENLTVFSEVKKLQIGYDMVVLFLETALCEHYRQYNRLTCHPS